MADTKYWAASEPQAVAEELIANGWEELRGHDLADIRYVFVNDEAGQAGCKRLASTRKLPGLQSALLGDLAEEQRFATVAQPIFVVVVSSIHWDILDSKQRRALIHHELSHINPIDGKLLPHFVEEHYQTYKRFGKWKSNLELFADATA